MEEVFKAKIVDNFKEVMQEYWKNDNDVDYSTMDNSFDKLNERISGKEVIIVKECYDYYCDYFEQIDSNIPLPPEAFVRSIRR